MNYSKQRQQQAARCNSCAKKILLKDALDIESTANEMLSLLPNIPYVSQSPYEFIWKSLIARVVFLKKDSNAKSCLCGDCFEQFCTIVRETMGVSKSDFAKFMNPKEATKAEKIQTNQKKLSGPFSSKTVSNLKIKK